MPATFITREPFDRSMSKEDVEAAQQNRIMAGAIRSWIDDQTDPANYLLMTEWNIIGQNGPPLGQANIAPPAPAAPSPPPSNAGGTTLFREKAPAFMRKLMKDCDLTEIQSAGVFGNIGHECSGFRGLHEEGQPEGRGGYGWAQWTEDRRTAFFNWCAENRLEWTSDDANYSFLLHELQNSEAATVIALKATETLVDAVHTFQLKYERAGVINDTSRLKWANIALLAFNSSPG